MASKGFENQRTASQIVKHRVKIIREEFIIVQIQVKPGEYEDSILECTVTNDGMVLAENVQISEEFHECDG